MEVVEEAEELERVMVVLMVSFVGVVGGVRTAGALRLRAAAATDLSHFERVWRSRCSLERSVEKMLSRKSMAVCAGVGSVGGGVGICEFVCRQGVNVVDVCCP